MRKYDDLVALGVFGFCSCFIITLPSTTTTVSAFSPTFVTTDMCASSRSNSILNRVRVKLPMASVEQMESLSNLDYPEEEEGDFLDDEEFDDEEFDEGSLANAAATPEVSSQPIRRYQGSKKEPLITIIGRPNVGKSALVNRIADSHKGGAIVADQSGITRDRTYRHAEFLGEDFQLVDTGGLVFDDDENTIFAKEIQEQAMVALDESSAVIFVVDGQSGISPMDLDIADFLRKKVSKFIPIHIAVNKCESEKTGPVMAANFWELGLGDPFPVSALHGVGTFELMEQIFASIDEKGTAFKGFGTKVKAFTEAKAKLNTKGQLPGEDEVDYKMRKYHGIIGDVAGEVKANYEEALEAFDFDNADKPNEINIAIIGRPNVGKSSLLNNVFGSNRAIVSDMAGTTRDSIDALMERPGENGEKSTIYRFVDTAGIRKKGKVQYGPEFFMVNRALRAIRRADVALLVLDATAGVTEQDRILAQKISDDGRACLVICNKWDAVVDKDSSTYEKSVKYIREELNQVRWAPILFVSAKTGQRVKKIYSLIDEAITAHQQRISTAVLNEVLRDTILWQPPPARKRNGSQAKIYYCHQVATCPPTIVVFVNDPKLLNDNYRRYIDRKFRENLHGFEATPIRWIFRGKRNREIARGSNQNGNPGDGGTGTSYPFPHAN